MRYFKSDNTAAVSREILEALAAANTGVALAYGADRWSEALTKQKDDVKVVVEFAAAS